jgi:hypothetical protein
MRIVVEVKGLQEVTQRLNNLGRKGWAIMGEAEKQGAEYLKLVLKQTTNNWKHRVYFKSDQKVESLTERTINISTNDKVWNMLNRGTRPHQIVAHNPSGRLWFFAVGFVPKTYPGVLYSSPGTAAYYDFRSPQSVQHPGTIARDWSGQVKRDYGDKTAKIMKDYAKNELDKAIHTTWTGGFG